MKKDSKKEPTRQQLLDMAAFWGVDKRTIEAWVKKQDKRLTHPDSKAIYDPQYPIVL